MPTMISPAMKQSTPRTTTIIIIIIAVSSSLSTVTVMIITFYTSICLPLVFEDEVGEKSVNTIHCSKQTLTIVLYTKMQVHMVTLRWNVHMS